MTFNVFQRSWGKWGGARGLQYLQQCVGGDDDSAFGLLTLSVSAPGAVQVTATPPSPNPDGLAATVHLTAVAAADAYTFGWDANLAASNTVQAAYGAPHTTTASLSYGGGAYVSPLSAADAALLVAFSTSDEATINVTADGGLTGWANSVSGGTVTLVANLRRSGPFDYDLGAISGQSIAYSAGDSQLCLPLTLYSASAVSMFQFVLRFDAGLLGCSAASCGVWTPGPAWIAMGTSAALSPDAGQVDVATIASVAHLGLEGDLDLGSLCLDVVGSGSLSLQVQMKLHTDSGGTRSCEDGPHLYQHGLRCYSRTPEARFDVSCSGTACTSSNRRLSNDGVMALPPAWRPMNIDNNDAQLTVADCLHLTSTQQAVSGFPSATQALLSALDPHTAFSFNPNMDFYAGSTTPVVDSKDAVYCINYVLKRWRFIYGFTVACATDANLPRLTLDLAGGKVGELDQAEALVAAPAVGTTVVAIVHVDCRDAGGALSVDSVPLLPLGASGTTSPFVVTLDTRCPVHVASYTVQLASTQGSHTIEVPWPDSGTHNRWLSPWGALPPQRHVQREAAELATTATLTVTTTAIAIAPAASHTSDQHISDCCAKRLTR